MTTKSNIIIKELKEEVEKRKIMIKRYESSIKVLSNECVERLRIIQKLEEE